VIIFSIVAYYVLAIGLIAAVLYLTVRQAKRRMDATSERLAREFQRQWDAMSSLSASSPRSEMSAAVDEDEADEDDVPDLSAPALRPIAPLLLRAAKEYLDKPHDRERLLRSLSEALGEPAPAT
jgi:hypothetical protein